MEGSQWDKKLKIDTVGRDASHADVYRYPYEPTDYAVLQRLADSGLLQPENVLVDYGCGKGRVSFFLNHAVGCRSVGVEYDSGIYAAALKNLQTFAGDGVSFVCCGAEHYQIEDGDCFYFFNPFSLEVLQSVYGKILEAYYDRQTAMRLFFYYPEDTYVRWLMTRRELQFFAQIDCGDLFPGKDAREHILVLELPDLWGGDAL